MKDHNFRSRTQIKSSYQGWPRLSELPPLVKTLKKPWKIKFKVKTMSLTSPNHGHTSYMDIINVTLDPKHCATHFLHLDFGDSQLKSMKAETLTVGAVGKFLDRKCASRTCSRSLGDRVGLRPTPNPGIEMSHFPCPVTRTDPITHPKTHSTRNRL